MEVILEFFFSIFGEMLLQLLAEVLLDLGMDSLAETVRSRKKRNPVYAFFGYALLGGLIGGLSLLIFPELLLDNKSHAIGNMIITPLVAGLMMMSIGLIKRRRHKIIIRLDSFLFGYIFALMMAVTRYIFG